MLDFKILTAKIQLPISTITPIRGFLPPAILVSGQDLNKVDVILYNGVPAQDFIVQSSTRLIIAIPESQVGRDIFNLQIISKIPIPTSTSAITLEIGKPLKTISGIERLVQAWLILFMTNPNSDIFSPDSGGGGRKIIGKTTDSAGKSASADLSLAVDRTNSELLKLQSQNPRIPPEEKLLSASITNITFDTTTTILSASVSIINMAGNTGEVSVN